MAGKSRGHSAQMEPRSSSATSIPKALEALAKEIDGLITAVCDISKPDDVDRMVSLAVNALGGLDVLVNNAGISGPPTAPVEQIPPDDWEKVVQVNLNGTFNVTRLAIPHLKNRPPA